MKLSVAQLRNIIKEEVSRMLAEGKSEGGMGLSNEAKKEIEAALKPILDKGIPRTVADKIGSRMANIVRRELEKLARERHLQQAAHEGDE